MRNSFIVLALILVIIAPSFAIQNDTETFRDGFDNGNANHWQVIQWSSRNQPGSWDMNGGTLNVKTIDYAGGMGLAPDFVMNESDYTIEADVMVTRSQIDGSAGGGPNGIIFIGIMNEGTNAGYTVGLSPYPDSNPDLFEKIDTACIATIDTNQEHPVDRVCSPVPTQNQLNTWYHLKFEKNGSTVRGYRNSKLIVQQDIGSANAKTRPAIFFFEGEFKVDNFTVNAKKTPELEVVDEKLNAPATISQDNVFTANATIRNRGTVNVTGFNVTFYSRINGIEKAECIKRIEKLSNGSSVGVSCSINATDPGFLDLSISADSGNEIIENDKSDNSATARVVVTPKLDSSIWLIVGAAVVILILIGLGVLFIIYKALTHKAPSGNQTVKCKRCGMMLSQDVKTCPVCGEVIE
ncbi:MAG: hypothetical protein NTY68_04600 [Candidatus Micrarchaeota archaeon]|nr:hypothetical protein [Candidatus Micrarchaeota archaeon]